MEELKWIFTNITKEILEEYGIKIPTGAISYSPEQAVYRARDRWKSLVSKGSGSCRAGEGWGVKSATVNQKF